MHAVLVALQAISERSPHDLDFHRDRPSSAGAFATGRHNVQFSCRQT